MYSHSLFIFLNHFFAGYSFSSLFGGKHGVKERGYMFIVTYILVLFLSGMYVH